MKYIGALAGSVIVLLCIRYSNLVFTLWKGDSVQVLLYLQGRPSGADKSVSLTRGARCKQESCQMT